VDINKLYEIAIVNMSENKRRNYVAVIKEMHRVWNAVDITF
jgi:hypothetical protein